MRTLCQCPRPETVLGRCVDRLGLAHERLQQHEPRELIHEIRALEMNVAHIVHRHGMSEPVAKEVESALIDAYPGLVNRVAGSGADRGTRHVNEIVLEYSTEEFEAAEPLILISIGKLWKQRGVYGAVRGVWRLRLEKAKSYKLVLAHVRGVARGAFRPTGRRRIFRWMVASSLNVSALWVLKLSPKCWKGMWGKEFLPCIGKEGPGFGSLLGPHMRCRLKRFPRSGKIRGFSI